MTVDHGPGSLTAPSAAGAAPLRRRPRPSRRDVLRIGFAVAWPLALATWLTYAVGRYGFGAMDQGFTQALSWRILDGQVPHADFFSPRPLGSAVFHIVDFALPGPLMLGQAWIAVLQFVVSAIALTVLVTGRPWTRFGPLLVGLTSAAAMVNLHMWPAMTWHTTDGIFFASLGWCLLDRGLRRGSAAASRWGLFLSGYAVTCKQSFAPVALVALTLLFLHPRRRDRPTRRGTARDLAALAAAPAAYLAWVVAGGGTAELPDQLLGADSVWGERLLTLMPEMLRTEPRQAWLLGAYLAVLATLAAVRNAAARGRSDRMRRAARWADPAACLAATALLAAEIAQARLVFAEIAYSCVLWWMLAAAIAADAWGRRRIRTGAPLVLALGWMVSLSYGYDVPALLAGSLGLTTAFVLWRGAPTPASLLAPAVAPDRRARLLRATALTAAGAAVLVLTAGRLTAVRDTHTYIDGGRPELTWDLGSVSAEMRGIRTSPGTHRYLAQIRDCVRARPAGRIAVLPDNAFAYAVFGLHNPFPLDWTYSMEVTNPEAEKLMLKRAKELDREGDYLVLFQTLDTRFAAQPGYVPRSVPPDQPVRHWTKRNIEAKVKRELHGETFACGSFVAVWAPPKAR
ncbi:hypothetical protein [Yinghuangia soli]|uniref:Uncharacterized protein n=1 Tax=Yinghuangia soli TaxID=2908204 RepID=A0AA41Q355_9ACTN|nr:hypothetical protein [Yinghuangia soli]MCF2530456.1 hypothetical protein [Yinghuangia soli]